MLCQEDSLRCDMISTKYSGNSLYYPGDDLSGGGGSLSCDTGLQSQLKWPSVKISSKPSHSSRNWQKCMNFACSFARSVVPLPVLLPPSPLYVVSPKMFNLMWFD